jgi:hypothetical protein
MTHKVRSLATFAAIGYMLVLFAGSAMAQTASASASGALNLGGVVSGVTGIVGNLVSTVTGLLSGLGL